MQTGSADMKTVSRSLTLLTNTKLIDPIHPAPAVRISSRVRLPDRPPANLQEDQVDQAIPDRMTPKANITSEMTNSSDPAIKHTHQNGAPQRPVFKCVIIVPFQMIRSLQMPV